MWVFVINSCKNMNDNGGISFLSSHYRGDDELKKYKYSIRDQIGKGFWTKSPAKIYYELYCLLYMRVAKITFA